MKESGKRVVEGSDEMIQNMGTAWRGMSLFKDVCEGQAGIW